MCRLSTARCWPAPPTSRPARSKRPAGRAASWGLRAERRPPRDRQIACTLAPPAPRLNGPPAEASTVWRVGRPQAGGRLAQPARSRGRRVERPVSWEFERTRRRQLALQLPLTLPLVTRAKRQRASERRGDVAIIDLHQFVSEGSIWNNLANWGRLIALATPAALIALASPPAGRLAGLASFCARTGSAREAHACASRPPIWKFQIKRHVLLALVRDDAKRAKVSIQRSGQALALLLPLARLVSGALVRVRVGAFEFVPASCSHRAVRGGGGGQRAVTLMRKRLARSVNRASALVQFFWPRVFKYFGAKRAAHAQNESRPLADRRAAAHFHKVPAASAAAAAAPAGWPKLERPSSWRPQGRNN